MTVGKKIGTYFYIHKDSISYIENEPLQKKLTAFIKNIHERYNIIKVNMIKGNVSLLLSSDFDVVDEPFIDKVYVFKHNKLVKILDYTNRDIMKRQIYHHKWTMVHEDYQGFDRCKSIERSLWWLNHPVVAARKRNDKSFSSKIGKFGYWNDVMLEIKKYDVGEI